MNEIRTLLDRIPMVAGVCIDNEDIPGAILLLTITDWLEGRYQDLTESQPPTAESEYVRQRLWLGEALGLLKGVRDEAAALPTDQVSLSRMLLLDQLMDDMSRYRGTLRGINQTAISTNCLGL